MTINLEHAECAIHHKVEPHQEDSIWCPECWHTYWDAEALIAAELYEWGSDYEGRPPPTVDDIHCCPLCVHDW